jgi:hypothetical protein
MIVRCGVKTDKKRSNELFLGTNNFDGTSQKGKYKRLLVH